MRSGPRLRGVVEACSVVGRLLRSLRANCHTTQWRVLFWVGAAASAQTLRSAPGRDVLSTGSVGSGGSGSVVGATVVERGREQWKRQEPAARQSGS